MQRATVERARAGRGALPKERSAWLPMKPAAADAIARTIDARILEVESRGGAGRPFKLSSDVFFEFTVHSQHGIGSTFSTGWTVSTSSTEMESRSARLLVPYSRRSPSLPLLFFRFAAAGGPQFRQLDVRRVVCV